MTSAWMKKADRLKETALNSLTATMTYCVDFQSSSMPRSQHLISSAGQNSASYLNSYQKNMKHTQMSLQRVGDWLLQRKRKLGLEADMQMLWAQRQPDQQLCLKTLRRSFILTWEENNN